jgi:hypothetical protein
METLMIGVPPTDSVYPAALAAGATPVAVMITARWPAGTVYITQAPPTVPEMNRVE